MFEQMQVMMATAGTNDEAVAAGILALGIGILIVILGGLLLIQLIISFLLMRIQDGVPHEHREIPAGLPFILVIPVVNSILSFFVLPKIASSYARASAAAGLPVDEGFGKIGMATCICWVVGAFGGFIPVVGCFSGIASLGALVLIIIFLVKGFSLKGQLAAMRHSAPPMAAG